jgi:hypothetical protein
MFSFQQVGKQEDRTHFILNKGKGVKVAQTMYTHVSKCKKDKIKKEKPIKEFKT